jgi:hypothetical protein
MLIMNTEINKNKTYTKEEKTPIVGKTNQSDKTSLNTIFNQIVQKIKDKHLS